MAKHTFCHVEWSSTDLERTKNFLNGLFEWKFEPFGDNYLMFSTPEGPGGGIMKSDEVRPTTTPTVYVEVEEIEPYLEKAKNLGGGVAVPKTEIPTVGWFAHIKDPDGNVVGVFLGGSQE
jgi:predicted enzyme related to lactoylglutathione lyase